MRPPVLDQCFLYKPKTGCMLPPAGANVSEVDERLAARGPFSNFPAEPVSGVGANRSSSFSRISPRPVRSARIRRWLWAVDSRKLGLSVASDATICHSHCWSLRGRFSFCRAAAVMGDCHTVVRRPDRPHFQYVPCATPRALPARSVRFWGVAGRRSCAFPI